MSPKTITSARPQGVNETSNFTDDVCRAASKIVNDYKKTVFTNFAIDRVSVRNTRHYEKHVEIFRWKDFLPGRS